jgi:hypothetical protein
VGTLSPSEWELAAFEEQLGVRVPRALKAFLLDGDPSMLPVFALGVEARVVERFYALGSDDPMFDLAVRHQSLEGIVPPHLLAFARDDRRDLVCIGVTGRRRGAIYLFRIPRSCYAPRPVRLLAPNLNAFLDRRSEPRDHVDHPGAAA